MSEKRKKVWIDGFQTQLSIRIVLYFVLYQIAVWSVIIISRGILVTLGEILGQEAAVYCFLFLVAAVLGLGLLFIYDAISFTHRIVGPLYRFRQTIKAITAGEDMTLINLRKGDFLQEIKNDVNEMLRALEQRGALALKEPKASHPTKHPLSV